MKNQARFPLVLASLAGLAAAADGAILGWNNPAGGSTATAANWSPAQVPVAGDTLNFNVNATYNLTLAAATPSSDLMSFVSGTITMTAAAPHTTNRIVVGASSISVTNTLTTGTLNTSDFTIAQTINNASTFNVNDADAALVVNNTSAIGLSGIGTLNITGFGSLTSSGPFLSGSNNATGNITVSGATAAQRSRIVIAADNSSVNFGNGGTSTTNITSGGLISVDRTVQFAPVQTSTATCTIAGSSPSGNVPATLSTTSDLRIASNSNGGSLAGTATINVNTGGLLTVADQTFIGDVDGSTGRLNIDGGEFRTRELVVTPTHGRIDILDGLAVIDGGTFTLPSDSFIMNGSNSLSLPVLRFDSGASMTTVNTLGLATTAGRRARLEVLDGSVVTVGTALNLGSDATAIVQGTGSQLNMGSGVVVGTFGPSDYQVLDGAHTSSNSLAIAIQALGTGAATVSGVGSQSTTNILSVGGTTSTPGGTGTLRVLDGGSMTVNNTPLVPVVVHTGGTVLVNSASSLSIANNVDLRGSLQMSGGTFTAASMTATLAASISGTGRIDSSLASNSTSTSLTLSGPLEIGRTAGTSSFSLVGPVAVGSHTLSLRTTSNARLGDLSIGGGTVTMLNPHSIVFANGDSLVGSGTLNGNVQINGSATVTPTGAIGLVFTGVVSPQISPSISVNGSRVRLNGTTSGFTGAGTFNCIFVTTGATITATGPISVGNGAAGCVAIGGGTILLGEHTLTFNSPDGINGANLTDIRGGTINAVSYELFNNNVLEELRGFGTINAALRNFEKIAPAGPGIDPTGRIHVSGQFSMIGNASSLDMDIEAGDFDQMTCPNNITLDGTLTVQFVNGFVPTPGDNWPIIRCLGENIGGDFDVVNLPPECVLLRTADTVSVYFPCLSDTDADGDADSDDIIAFFAAWDAGNPEGDIDGDGDDDSDDIIAYFAAFDTGC